jgi:hypothetical protein
MPKTTVFTLCSVNYLAHAITLGDSLAEHNPDYHFVIGLVDRLPEGLNMARCPYEVIPVEKLGMENFWDMVERYDVVEFNTAVKPFYMEYLYERDPDVQAVIYLDPDIVIYSTLQPLADKLSQYSIILTPHHCTYDDSDTNLYFEQCVLNFGVYNLGFIATSRSDVTRAFLKWWKKRLRLNCYYQPATGYFVDQLWMTLAPLYFSGVYVDKDPGYDMAYWNLFERRLTRRNGQYLVNDEQPLRFYHFSGFDPAKPGHIFRRPRMHIATFSERPDIKPIYDDYRQRLFDRDLAVFKTYKYSLRRNLPASDFGSKKFIKAKVRNALGLLPFHCQAVLKRFAQFTINSFK